MAAAWTSLPNVSVTFVFLMGTEELNFMFSVQCSHGAPSNRIHHMQILGRMVTTGWTAGIIHIWQFFTYLFTFFPFKTWSQNPQMSFSICTLLFYCPEGKNIACEEYLDFCSFLTTSDFLSPDRFSRLPCVSAGRGLEPRRALRSWYKRHFTRTPWKSVIYIHLLLWRFSLESPSCLSTPRKRTGLISITNIILSMVWR